MLRALPSKQEQPVKSTRGALGEKLDPETKSTQSNDQYPEHSDLKHEDIKLLFARGQSDWNSILLRLYFNLKFTSSLIFLQKRKIRQENHFETVPVSLFFRLTSLHATKGKMRRKVAPSCSPIKA